jgi:hypothetical protein
MSHSSGLGFARQIFRMPSAGQQPCGLDCRSLVLAWGDLMASELELESLHVDCVRALRSYIRQASRTCKLLTKIKKFPLSRDARIEMLDQRLLENQAHGIYQRTRRELFRAAKWT